MLGVLAGAGANILTVQHDKLSAGLTPNETYVHVACEVGGPEHGNAVIGSLKACGYMIELS